MSNSSAKQSLKNSGIVSISRVVMIIITVAKTKVIAVLLGPIGIGLLELFTSSLGVLNSVFGLGLGFSAVRDLSLSNANQDVNKVSKKFRVLIKWSVAAGVVGVLLTVIFSKSISYWTFGSYDRHIEVCLVSVNILLYNLSVAYVAKIQGARRMADFAYTGILGAIWSLIVSLPLLYFYQIDGIVPSLVLSLSGAVFINFYYSKKVKTVNVPLTFKEIFTEGRGMIELGVFTVFTGVMSQGTLYLVRVLIGENLGLSSVGYFSVASTLTVQYMSIIFTSLGADYFPKLSAISENNVAINKSVIEQTGIVLILGVPLILGMYTFSDYIIELVYAKNFLLAQPLLMWMLFSVLFRLIAFPIGYVFLAKGKSKIFIFTQTLWNLVFLLFAYIAWRYNLGLEGIGAAYVVAYFIGWAVNYFIVRRLTGFSYNRTTFRLILLITLLTLFVFCLSYFFDDLWIFILKIAILSVVSFFSLKKINAMFDGALLLRLKKCFK